MNVKRLLLGLLFCLGNLYAQVDIYDSGGPLMTEQAAYDVQYYDLHLNVNPADSSISGHVVINSDIVQPIDQFVVDLDTLLQINSISEFSKKNREIPREFSREIGKVWISLGRTVQPGEKVSIKILYNGQPKVAKWPPWDGGFTWEKTQDGSDWIATTCQGEGPDIWWPTKDHISDKPDSMGIHIRVPDPLICATNGKLRSVDNNEDNTSTSHWFVSTPINSYNVTLNIAPYKLIEYSYESVAGDVIPVKFWVLPEDYEKGVGFLPEIIEHLRFFENTLGPYPFRADKYGVVQTPHLGMEHQTIIAYGAKFDNSAMTRHDWGFDALHHHELSHEWWGNMVTCLDWRDMWLHEGFGSYMQGLYIEEKFGLEKYLEFVNSRRNFNEAYAIAPLKTQTSEEIYKAPIYAKGSWVLHTLRYLIGDEAMRNALRRMAYPDPAMEKITNGDQVRFASTDEFRTIAEKISGQKLDWFFNVYTQVNHS